MELGGTVWILCAFWVGGVISVQEFDIRPKDVEVNPGETAQLTCKVRNRKGECAWLKNGQVVGKIENKYEFRREPPDGDCSIRIKQSKLEEDDGMWQCQVTQTSLQEPTLTSEEVKFTVREAPQPPRFEDNTSPIQTTEAYSVHAGSSKRLHCVSRKGNPPAELRWFIDDSDVTSMANQTNTTDVNKAKTWQAVSVLDYTFQKEHNEKFLRCVAIHPAYSTRSMEIKVKLAVLYPPKVRLEGTPTSDVEEGQSLSLKCVADANPTAKVIWNKSGFSSIYTVKEQIDFMPVKRTDSGVYTCLASNDIGSSEVLKAELDVKFKPKILRVSPNPGIVVSLYNASGLECEAEGNPPPRYSWLQKEGGNPVVWRQRGNTATLHIPNVTYSFQGRYMCEADNVINGHQYKATSEEITLDVTGAPQVLMDDHKTKERVIVEKDEDATITVYFCSDPQPRRTFWEWGSLKLDTGSNLVGYIAEPLLQDGSQEDCYEARLIVQSADGSASRKYTLNVENDKGKETYAVALEVREPVAMSVVIGIVVGCIILLVIVVLIVLYLLKAEKMCFSRTHGFNPEVDSDAESGRSADLMHNGRTGAIPPDALYASPKENSISTTATERARYENLKPDQNDNRNKDSLVYADLDLPNLKSDRNGQSRGKGSSRPRQERTEYAEIQFTPKVTEQADI